MNLLCICFAYLKNLHIRYTRFSINSLEEINMATDSTLKHLKDALAKAKAVFKQAGVDLKKHKQVKAKEAKLAKATKKKAAPAKKKAKAKTTKRKTK
jgi:multidrug resistance efflux pump